MTARSGAGLAIAENFLMSAQPQRCALHGAQRHFGANRVVVKHVVALGAAGRRCLVFESRGVDCGVHGEKVNHATASVNFLFGSIFLYVSARLESARVTSTALVDAHKRGLHGGS